jgi:proline iminopeptidase
MHGAGEYVASAGGRTWIELEGEGETVVVAGGGPGNGHSHYHPWFSALAQRCRVVHFDYLGTGRSDRLPRRSDHTIERFAGQIEAIRRHLALERLSLIGVSFGGMPALAYALAHPRRVRRLVLSSAQVSARTWQEGAIDGVNAALRAHFPERWAELLALRARGVRSLDEGYQARYADLLARLEWFEPDRRPRLHHDDFNPEVYAGVVGEDPEWRVSGTMAGFDPCLARVRAPTLVVTGRWDRLTPPAIAASAAREIPGAELVVFERSAHRPWAEEPGAYFETVGAFIAGARTPSAARRAAPPPAAGTGSPA